MLFPYVAIAMALNNPSKAEHLLPILLATTLSVEMPMTGGAAQQGDSNETNMQDQSIISDAVAQHSMTIKTKMNQKCVCEKRCVCSGCGDSQNGQRRCVYCACDESEVACNCQYREQMGIGQSIMQRIWYLLGVPKNS